MMGKFLSPIHSQHDIGVSDVHQEKISVILHVFFPPVLTGVPGL
jgi:hypothetical protein